MIWLASYPRSGNTFFRIVLHEVYGIESSTYHLEDDYPVDADYSDYPVVKTHLLPSKLKPNDPSIPAVYLVRDGRDTIVSMAHQRKDFIDPYSNYYMNMREAILAQGDSYFGGWSKNVSQWIERASIVIKFEDLILDPVGSIEQLRSIMDLPQPDIAKLPSFQELKEKDFRYGTGKIHNFADQDREKRREFFFRRGKIGGWKEEMPEWLHNLYWEHHGEVMDKMGYQKWNLSIFLWRVRSIGRKQSISKAVGLRNKKSILIEASKLNEVYTDGNKRYVLELLRALLLIRDQWQDQFNIDVFIRGEVNSLIEIEDEILFAWRGTVKKVIKTTVTAQQVQEDILRYLFTTKFADFLLLIKKIFPGLWKILKSFKKILKSIEQIKKSNKDRRRHNFFSNYDLIHITTPQNFTSMVDYDSNIVMTVHDFSHKYFPEFHLEANVLQAERGMQFGFDRKAKFIAVSEATKNDILAEYKDGVNARTTIIYEACDPNKFHPIKVQEEYNRIRQKYKIPDRPYFLCLSTLEPRKNLANTIQAFNQFISENPQFDMILVVAGKRGWKYDEIVNDDIVTDRIIFTGYIEEVDLPIMYSNAYAFLYVSFYEGFGLPLLEAMSCGTPVIYGNNSSMPEIVQNGGLPADPSSIESIMMQMKVLVEDNNKRDEMAKNAIERAGTFSWTKSAEETLKVYLTSLSH